MRAINLDTDWFYRRLGVHIYGFSETILNSLNQTCERIFAKELTSTLATQMDNGAARLVILLMSPVWKAMNFSEERQTELSSRIDKALRDGAVPIGISVAGAAILLSGLFFFH
jgi:multicomponent Na+:H+ antiporter subunit D